MNGKDVRLILFFGVVFLLFLILSSWTVARGPVPRFPTIPKELSAPQVTPTPPDAVAKALRELDTPEYRGIHINQPLTTKYPRGYLPHDYYETCADAIDLL